MLFLLDVDLAEEVVEVVLGGVDSVWKSSVVFDGVVAVAAVDVAAVLLM